MVLARLLSNSSNMWPNARNAEFRTDTAQVLEQQRVRRLDPVARHLVVQRYQAGESQVELAEAFGVHRDTIVRCLEAVEVVRRRPGLTNDEAARAAELYAEGLSLADVGSRLGKASSSVRASLLRNGVELRGRYDRRKLGRAQGLVVVATVPPLEND